MTRAIGLVAAAFFASAAHSEVTVSQSNDPSLQLGDEVMALVNMEHLALQTFDANKMVGKPTTPDQAQAITIEYSRAFVDSLPAAKGGDEWNCLTQALYFEARGESVKGQVAVAEVILNRVESDRFPETICGVVNQGTGKRYQCQFTYTCDGRAEVVHEKKAWDRVGKIARLMVDGAERKLTKGATHYHTRAVNPRWARVFPRTTTIGVHHFYRMPGGNA